MAIRIVMMIVFAVAASGVARAAERPNIVWLVSEDHGPHMGCYGDSFATTPNVDGLAAKGLRFAHCWSNAPVCAPARTTLITGMYANSVGGEHMRSMVPCPEGRQMYPQLLRPAGYYCTNNAKEDYNVAKPGKVWDESSKKAHWKNRPAGKPFFAVFNSEKSHESKIRSRPHQQVHDPAKVRIPAYHPDTPEVRQDWAQYYDVVTEADADAGMRLKELDEAGLLDETIVFYFGDHGSGMPRNKRWPQNSGLHVPLVVHIPAQFKDLQPIDYVAGGVSERLVSFVDFAPTLLSLAGVKPPEWMQGHAFLGKYIAPPQPYLYGFRGRMDERYDLVRSVTDGRYVYVRQYLPHLIYGQHVEYMFQTPTTVVWKRLHDEGKLNLQQDAFWNRKPPEELYDLQSDPDEVTNLAMSAEHQPIRDRLKKALQDHTGQIRDLGFLPEGERFRRAGSDSQYAMGHDDSRYPFDKIFAAAELASNMEPKAVPALKLLLSDSDSAVRYWGVLGLHMRGEPSVMGARQELRRALDEESPFVAIAAAQALAEFGGADDLKLALPRLVASADWSSNDVFVCVAALNSLDALEGKAAPMFDALQRLPTKGPVPDARYADYVSRLLKDLGRTGSE
ncbi:MAG: Sulfatase [Schlesneria sp.]|nr:Sulfatase [Schlesneria sp.]